MTHDEEIYFCEFCGERDCSGGCEKLRQARSAKNVKFVLSLYLDGKLSERYELKTLPHWLRYTIAQYIRTYKSRFKYELTVEPTAPDEKQNEVLTPGTTCRAIV